MLRTCKKKLKKALRHFLQEILANRLASQELFYLMKVHLCLKYWEIWLSLKEIVTKESKLSDNEITVVHSMYLPKESKLFTSE